MKRKTLLLSISALALLTGAVSGCQIVEDNGTSDKDGDKGGNTDPTTPENPDTPSTPVQTNDITFSGTSTIEVGQSVTIIISVANTTEDGTVDIEVEDASIVTLPNSVKGVASVKITGAAAGKTRLKATSCETKNYNYYEITVKESLPTPATILSKYVAYDNYTFVGQKVDASKRTDETTYYTKRISNAFTLTDKAGNPIWYVADNDVESGTDGLFGIGIATLGDYAGAAVQLKKPVIVDSTSSSYSYGSLVTTSQAIVDSTVGILTKTSFAGLGANASGPSQTGFSTLSNINPSWFVADKDYSNVYTIEGTETNYQAAYLECVIWSLVDPTGLQGAMRYKNDYYYTSAATWVTTTITVNEDQSLTFKVTPSSGLKTKASDTATAVDYSDAYEGTVSDIGTTTLAAEYTTALTSTKEGEGLTATEPSTATDVANARKALNNNDYHKTVSLGTYYTDSTKTDTFSVDYDVYYTENYVFFDYDSEFNENYKKVANQYPGGSYLYPEAYVVESDGYIHDVTFNTDYTVKEDTKTTYANDQSTTVGVTDYLHVVGRYYKYSAFEMLGGAFNLSTTARQLFSSISDQFYYTYNTSASMELLYDYFTSMVDDGYTEDSNGLPVIDSKLTMTNSSGTKSTVIDAMCGMSVETKSGTTTPESVSFMLFLITSYQNGYSYGSADLITFDSFGTATTNNANTALSALVSGSTTDTNA